MEVNMDYFDIPVVLFIFKRDKAVEVVKRISEVKPKKIYLLGDNGRNEEEKKQVIECRTKVENAINWECEVIKNYANENRGVFENIGLGAKWIFEREEKAIFLEDDNLPEVSFFQYCKELLEYYVDDTRVLWICGTNYLEEYIPEDGSSYMFTKHMLPCGWASWGYKFNKFYDIDLKLVDDKKILKKVKRGYLDKRIFTQYSRCWKWERTRIKNKKKPISWDYHIDFSIKLNNLYGISPYRNQIKNIGVDDFSIHGGNSKYSIMNKRFCGMDSLPLEFPLKHPQSILPDNKYERRIAKILKYPLIVRILNFKTKLLKLLKKGRI